VSNYQAPHYEKSNHHYVPQHWQRRFRDAKNQLWVKEGKSISVRGTSTTMTDDDTYTSFNERYEPSDAIENALAREEARQAAFLTKLIGQGYVPTDEDRINLCNVLALQAVRHPDVMARSRKQAVDVAEELALAHEMTRSDFLTRFSDRTVPAEELGRIYDAWQLLPQEELIRQAAVLGTLSPQDPMLPYVYALSAWTDVFLDFAMYQVEILDAPPGYSFVLADTPMPQSGARGGFSVPLSLAVAVVARLEPGEQPTIVRKAAKRYEVWAVNQEQWDRHKTIVVGDKSVLAALNTESSMPTGY
jgi:Protein of unknown function (DUF4238)